VESGSAESLEQQTSSDPVGELGGRRIDRRRLLIRGSATGIAATAASLGVASSRAQEATPAPATPVGGMPDHDMAGMATGPQTNQGFTVFVPYHAAIVQAAAARLIPTDEHGPGATEAGVVYFIDRQLARGNMGFRGKEYQLGPFLPGEPTQGDQSALPLRDRFRLGILALDAYAQDTYGRGFVACSPDEQDRLLSDLEQGIPETFGSTAIQAQPLVKAPTEGSIGLETAVGATGGAQAFFTLLLSWTMAGFFCDPVQGGNRDMVGWMLIGFPGAHVSYADEIERYNQPFQGEYISLGQYQEQAAGGS
jgi:gluconate 2-dehydrogenase gamma chain